jgi:hypothetical protein
VAFNQKLDLDYLTTASSVDRTKRVADRYPFSLMQETDDRTLQPNVVATLRASATPRQWFTGKGWGYTNPSVMRSSGTLQQWLGGARRAMDAMGYKDLVSNDATDGRASTVVQMATHMHPPPRSIVHKHCLRADKSACAAVEEASVIHTNSSREMEERGAGSNGATLDRVGGREEDGAVVVVLADPVVAPAIGGTGDMDPHGTVAAVLASAQHRRYFWVFIDHQMSVGALETTLDLLTMQAGGSVVLLSIDELVRVYLRDRVLNMSLVGVG